MYIVLLLLSLASLYVCAPRSPKIYNVLISTKKNLAPSQALPVYEPVLRTTSLGFAFSPLVYTPISTIQSSPSRYINEGSAIQSNIINQPLEEAKKSLIPTESDQTISNQLQHASSNGIKNLPQNVVPLQQYVPYYTAPQLSYEPYHLKQKQKVAEKIPVPNLEQYYENVENDPKQIVANLKKNSDIPDVPPPPLPVRNL